MPPPHHIATGLRGFICKSCSSKLSRGPWLSRTLSTERRPRRRKGAAQTPDLRFYEQYPDGTRRDVTNYDDLAKSSDDAFGIEMMKRIESLEAQTGKSIEELADGKGIDLDAGEEIGKDSGLVPSLAEVAAEVSERTDASETLQAMLERLDGIPNLKSLSEEGRSTLRADILELMKDETKADAVSGSSDAAGNLAPSYPVQSPTQAFLISHFPHEYQNHLNEFKKAIENYDLPPKASRTRNRKLRDKKFPHTDRLKTLQRAYSLARKGLMSSPSKVPPSIWNQLWQALSVEGQHNPDRMYNLKRIGEDMDEIGAALQPSQQLLYIEALFVEGFQKSALEKWERARHLAESLGNEYWTLGLRMSSDLGQLEQASEAAEALFRDQSRDVGLYRSLIPLIHAYLASDTEFSVQRAWALFVRLRANLGSQMTIEDYDAVISSFMRAGEQELGLAAFRDMMLTGDNSISVEHDSISVQKSFAGSENMSGVNIKSKELVWTDPKLLSALPAKMKNKYFLGSWVKKLIGDGDLKAAKQVLDLMQDHGIRPSPIHMNGLLGAWFREGNEKDWDLAEQLAWKMIRTRIDYIEGRERKQKLREALQPPIRPQFSENRLNHQVLDLTPPATVETFTLLIREYRQRQRTEAMSNLFDAWIKTRIPANTRFMNQLLLMDLRGRHKNWAWETYCSLTEAQTVLPDARTLEILWDLMKRNCDPTKGVISSSDAMARRKFPTPRRLFAEMMKHRKTLSSKGPMSRDIYDMIILCFSLKEDQAGTAVALRALHRHFDMFPNHDTARMLIYQLSRLGLVNWAGIEPRRLNLKSQITQDRISAVTTLVQKFRDERIQALLSRGISYDDLTENQRIEETLLTFSDLLRYVAHSKMSAEDTSNTTAMESKKAAVQMGVPDCVAWENNV